MTCPTGFPVPPIESEILITVDGVLGLIVAACVILPGLYYICGGTDKPAKRRRERDRYAAVPKIKPRRDLL